MWVDTVNGALQAVNFVSITEALLDASGDRPSNVCPIRLNIEINWMSRPNFWDAGEAEHAEIAGRTKRRTARLWRRSSLCGKWAWRKQGKEAM